METIVVTGMGILSALGRGQQRNFQQLAAGMHGLSPLDFLETAHAATYPYGEIKMATAQLMAEAGLPEGKGFTRTSLLAILALQEAWEQAQLATAGPVRIGLINATTVGGMCEVENYYFSMFEHPERFSEYADTIDCADCTHRLADYFKIHHFVTTISTACSSSANALQLGARMLQQNMLDMAICGGTDALTRFTINGFNALKNIDRSYCRPFDANRNGLNLGEGAAYLVLEKNSHAAARGVQPIARLSGYCNFNEAFHPTAPNPQGEGASQAMQRALQKAGLPASAIAYINAHGTATLTNDESEGRAMKRVFGEVPPFSSTKCYTGHTLAAAGAIEAVFSLLAIQRQCRYANLHFQTPMPEELLQPLTTFQTGVPLSHVMSNSFAFGGNNTSLIFSSL